jgi:membrane fusion protein
MTLFRPEVINAQRRRVFGSVTLHQPARLVAFTAVAVVGVALGTAYLSLAQFARKETVAGWVAPGGGLSEVRIAQPGMIAALAVASSLGAGSSTPSWRRGRGQRLDSGKQAAALQSPPSQTGNSR